MKKKLLVVAKNEATKLMRFLNYVIDYALMYCVIMLYGMFSGIVSELLGIDVFYQSVLWLSELSRLEDMLFTSIVYFLFIFSFEYFTKGRSIGKYITGTMVVSIDGSELTRKDYFIRNISRLVPFDGLSFLGSNGWHDNWSDTQVVNRKGYLQSLLDQKEIESIGTVEAA